MKPIKGTKYIPIYGPIEPIIEGFEGPNWPGPKKIDAGTSLATPI